MNEINRHNLPVDASNQPASISKPGNLLDKALANLPPDQRQDLAQKALEHALEIDLQAKMADMRYRASSVDMGNTIHQVQALEESTKSDYTIKAEYETASGRINVEIRKSNNAVIITIAIVIGLLALIVLSNM